MLKNIKTYKYWYLKNIKHINEYANSMFRFEKISDEWIRKCTSYLRYLFGNSLKEKIVIDYAFGRGNWSLAFLKLGVKKVIAIDASLDNVNRFKEFITSRKIKGIEIIHGNLLKQDFNVKGNLIWLYGILQHIEEIDIFLNKIKRLANNKNTHIYIYHYNADSLREFIVQTCRNVIIYKNENEFVNDSFMFIKAVRMRARDDLITPYVTFRSAINIQNILKKHHIYISRQQDKDFQEFQNKIKNKEFYPYQFLCSLKQDDEISIRELEDPFTKEILILKEIAKIIFFKLGLSYNEKKKIAIGLYNTHFSYLTNDAISVVVEDFLFLMYVLFQKEYELSKIKVTTIVKKYMDLCFLSMWDKIGKEKYFHDLGKNYITNFLIENRIRI